MEQNNQPQPPVFNPQQSTTPQYQPAVTATPMMDPVEAVKTCIKKYVDFKGRARRSEYWWFVLFVAIVQTAFSYAGLLWPVLSFVGVLCTLALVLPSFAVMTRRLHDTGRSGWWVLTMGALYVILCGALATALMPAGSQLLEVTDAFEQATLLADAFQASPTAATVMMASSLAIMIISIIVLVFTVLDSKWGENKYGPSPKYR